MRTILKAAIMQDRKVNTPSIRIWAGFVWLLIISVPGIHYASDSARDMSLTLRDCVDYALHYSPAIQAAFAKIDAQKYSVHSAEAGLWYPSMTLSAMTSYKWQDMTYSAPDTTPSEPSTPTTPSITYLPYKDPTDTITQEELFMLFGMNSDAIFGGMDFSSMMDMNAIQEQMASKYEPFAGQVQLQIAKPLFAGYALVNQVALENIKLHLARNDLDKTRRDLEKNIVESFFGVIFLKEMVEVTKESLVISKESLEGIEYNYERGLVDELTYLRFQIQYEQTVPQLISAQNQLRTAKESLLLLIGYEEVVEDDALFEEIHFVGNFEEEAFTMQYDEVIESMLAHRTEFKQMDLQRDQMDIQKQLVRAQFYPTVSLFANASFVTSNHFSDERAMYGFTVQGGIQISFSLSDLLFPKNKTRSSLEALDYSIRAIDLGKRSMTDMYSIEVRANIRTLQQAKENLSIKRKIKELTDRTFEIAQDQLTKGLITFLDFREIEMQYLQAQLAVIQELYNYNKALINLKYAIGQRLIED